MQSGKTGLVVAAAFIGPGTVTTATLAGAQLGYGLFWGLVFSVFATIIIQEMASRLGLVTGRGLSENLTNHVRQPIIRFFSFLLVICAIGVGNSAYQAGNLSGASLGLSSVIVGSHIHWVSILAFAALLLIWSNSYRLIESALLVLVALMSAVFIFVACIAGIDLSVFSAGLKMENLLSNSTLLLAIIGTTIVPYNIFLHSSISAQTRINNVTQQVLKSHRIQTGLSISIGGLITFAIMSSATNAYFITQTQVDANNLSEQLKPLLGNYASWFFALGLFAAGLTSAITAPLATAYAVDGLFNQSVDITSARFKILASIVVTIGALIAVSGLKPLAIIVLAQASNAILLPFILIVLLFLMNSKHLMGEFRNSGASNFMGGLIVIVVMGLGLMKWIFA